MRKYKNWFSMAISSLVLLLLFIIIFCFFIDPYNVYHNASFKVINEKKIQSKEYLMKTRSIAKLKPEVIFLGSSRTSVGLDPDLFKELTGETAYNVGLSGAGIYEQLRYLEYALLNNNNLKRVIIGLDFEVFNANRNIVSAFKEERLHTKFWTKNDLLMTLLTKQAIEDSVKVVIDNVNNSQNYTSLPYLLNGSHNEDEILESRYKLLNNGGNPFYEYLREQLVIDGSFVNYELSLDKIRYLKSIVAICKDKDIHLDVFISPVHAIQLEGIREYGNWEQFETWKNEVVKIAPVWDFTGYNSITTKPPVNFDYYVDQGHYRKNVGNLVLKRMLGEEISNLPDDFGVYLTGDNFEEHRLRIRNERDKWANNNSDIIKRIKELKREE